MKARLFESIREELRAQLLRLKDAAQEAHAAATDVGSKAESKYDTRNLEASYLASGQAKQVEELAESLRLLEAFDVMSIESDLHVVMGSLVMTSGDDWYLLAPSAGGLEILHDGYLITVLTPSSPLYQNLLGKNLGDSIGHSSRKIAAIL
ncbi:MAG: hypothetical protein RLZZ553_478 [Verrucomicrobiota bacterium]|jgi:hypothetical protein